MVEFDHGLADELKRAADSRSTPYRRTTVSDIVREAVARFLLPREAIETSQSETDSSRHLREGGSL